MKIISQIKRALLATLLVCALLLTLAMPARAQIGTYTVPRIATLYTNTITTAATNPMVVGTNFLNYSGFHLPGFWLTIWSTNSLQAANGASAATNAGVVLWFDFSPGSGSGYTNALLGTNYAFSTTQPFQWLVIPNFTNNIGNVSTNAVVFTNLPPQLADSLQWWRLTKITSTATNPGGFQVQLDQSIAP